MSVVDPDVAPGLRRLRMSWDDYLDLPEKPIAEWVDGEVVVMPPTSFDHGQIVMSLGHVLRGLHPGLVTVTEVGVHLPRNRLRAPDLMVVTSRPEGPWVVDPPVLVVEVLSRSTRTEDLVRKSAEYAEGGIGQYWVVDPEARALEVFLNVDGEWQRVLELDDRVPTGEIVVGAHGTISLDLGDIFVPA